MERDDMALRWNVCDAAITAAAREIAALRARGETTRSSSRLRELEELSEVAKQELEELQREAGWTSDWR